MIDFHCHLDLFHNPIQVAARAAKEGVYVLSVTTTPSAWHGTKKLEEARIRTALGLHPQLAHERKSELRLFDELVSETPYIGEIGLDGAPEFKKQWVDQLAVFRHILLSCADAGGKIMSIHSRRASREVIDELSVYTGAGLAVLHWFSGSLRDLERAIELGCWFSIGPAMLLSGKGRDLVARMPKNRILTESDGPFAQIAEQPVMPWDMDLALQGLSGIWRMEKSDTGKILIDNFKAMMKLKAKGCGFEVPAVF